MKISDKASTILSMCADGRVKDSNIRHITEWLNLELDADFSPQSVREFLTKHEIKYKRGSNSIYSRFEPNTLIIRSNYLSQKWDKEFTA